MHRGDAHATARPLLHAPWGDPRRKFDKAIAVDYIHTCSTRIESNRINRIRQFKQRKKEVPGPAIIDGLARREAANASYERNIYASYKLRVSERPYKRKETRCNKDKQLPSKAFREEGDALIGGEKARAIRCSKM